MRLRRLPWFMLVMSLALVSSAQPKKRTKQPAKKEAVTKSEEDPLVAGDKPSAGTATEKPAEKSAADKGAGEKSAADKAPAGETSGNADDLGEAPPKQTGAGASKLSPLTPEPGEFPTSNVSPPPPSYDKLLAQIAALRSRVAAITTTLYKSKLRVNVVTEGDDAAVAGFVVTLDDGVVYTAPERFSPSEPQVVYFHAVAPGQHVVGVEVERYDARNRQYRTFQSSKFTLIVPENKTLEARVRVLDDSDMADDFPDDEDGEYDLRVRLRALVVE
ncbi:MAG TPA: hypothetical protein VGP93_17940 [Polyangiaceae bacterium]|nr:hypothetical protein [Polyangiaceae bacterium]